MKQLDYLLDFFRTVQRVLKIKDSVAVSLLSGFLGTSVMGVANPLFWRSGKTEALYGHIAGSVFMRPFRVKQRKNFWLGQMTHYITGAIVAYPLNYIFRKTGKDHYLLKGGFYGAVTWELIYGLGQRFGVYATKLHLTKTHYAELFNNILYGLATAQALVTFSEPSMFPNKTTNREKSSIQPIYSDINSDTENTLVM